MSLQDVSSAERLHIGFFGMRNTGKSSLVNAVTGQRLSVVSDVQGTTTDPVRKSMELLPLGPVLIIDTPGLDDEGTLGQLRVEKAEQILEETDIAVLVIDAAQGVREYDRRLIRRFQERKLPYLLAYNKADLLTERPADTERALYVSAATGEGIERLKKRLGEFAQSAHTPRFLIRDLVSAGDMIVLVIPVDEAAPKGRLIMPQQMTIRELLDAHAIPLCCQDTELADTLQKLKAPPKMVVTDSQAFARVSRDTPRSVPLTSFSILMARYKGELEPLVRGAHTLAHLRDGDRVLISEGCTHHRQCKDIGTVKLPGWIEAFSGAKPVYTFTSGHEFPEDLSPYRLAVHCGGCMLNEKAMQHRVQSAAAAGVPIVNYGVAIAHMNGILRRSLELFPDALSLLDDTQP